MSKEDILIKRHIIKIYNKKDLYNKNIQELYNKIYNKKDIKLFNFIGSEIYSRFTVVGHKAKCVQ